MNKLKRILGILWMMMGPAAVIFMVWQAYIAISKASATISNATGPAREAAELIKTNTILQWSIIIAVFVPIMIGLVIFGRYAWSGAYDRLPEDSSEV